MTMEDNRGSSMIIEDCLATIAKVAELKEGTFLVLEVVQEYENSGNCIRMQGKYQGEPMRVLLWDYGFLSEDNG